MTQSLSQIFLRPGYPDFLDLPWSSPIQEWGTCCERLEEVPRGLSRHIVVFANYGGELYAIKELPDGVAEHEYHLLSRMEELRLPVVTPVGFAKTESEMGTISFLFTRFLDRSLPFRTLFMRHSLLRYREHLLDSIAGLMVQLHLAGVYWGDCSLSNTLFRRDAGALQAYLVDAETAEITSERLSPTLRYHDLEIMDENVTGDMRDLAVSNLLTQGVPFADTGVNIRQRYDRLWQEITREVYVYSGEHYRIQERIRALNDLGFSVKEVELASAEERNQLRLRVVVTDRNFHRDQLQGLTGLDAEEMQARAMMNEIYELKATLSRTHNRSTPLSVAAYHWLENFYLPTIHHLEPILEEETDRAELYCQLLEHKWYLSERQQRDVGHQRAVEDFLQQFSQMKEN